MKTGRFCLDSSKLDEIEALTGSPPLSHQIEVQQLSAETSELNAAQSLTNGEDPAPALPQYDLDSVSYLLNERTESLLQRKGPKRSKKMSSKIIPEKARYRTEDEMMLEHPESVPLSRTAWAEQDGSGDAAQFIEAVSSIPRKEIANNLNLERGESFDEKFTGSHEIKGSESENQRVSKECDGPVAPSLIQHNRRHVTKELQFHPGEHRDSDRGQEKPDIQSPGCGANVEQTKYKG